MSGRDPFAVLEPLARALLAEALVATRRQSFADATALPRHARLAAALDAALGGHLAASTLVTVPALARPEWRMEIAVVAARPGARVPCACTRRCNGATTMLCRRGHTRGVPVVPCVCARARGRLRHTAGVLAWGIVSRAV